MTRSGIALIFLGMAFFAHAQTLEIHGIAEGVFVYTTYQPYQGTPFPANGLYLVTDQGVALIDTPWDTTQCQPLLDSIQARHHLPVRWSISTLAHADRTGSIDILRRKGVATYSSIMTQQQCLATGEPTATFGFARDTVFQFGNVRVETFYPGPGHAPDNIVVWLPQTAILHGGCFVKSSESRGLGNLADADVEKWPAAVKAVQQKYPEAAIIVPGHGKWTGKDPLKHTLKLLKKAD
jgi:metallo-beta-lactamase class B